VSITDKKLEFGGIDPDRSLQAGFSYVPERIELNEGALIYSNWSSKKVRPGPGLLEDFVQLYRSSDEEILKYARRWGVLGICEHGLPSSHNSETGPAGCFPNELDKGWLWFTEPVERWRYFSRKFSAIQYVGAYLNQDKLGDEVDWELIERPRVYLNQNFEPRQRPRFPADLAEGRLLLARELNKLIRIGQVRPGVAWDEKKAHWQITLEADSLLNLFGLVGLSLVQSICRQDLVICSACGNSYKPKRRPNPERRNYCLDCRARKISKRDASRDDRKRKRQKRRSLRKRKCKGKNSEDEVRRPNSIRERK
jgi:hypothetical protein